MNTCALFFTTTVISSCGVAPCLYRQTRNRIAVSVTPSFPPIICAIGMFNKAERVGFTRTYILISSLIQDAVQGRRRRRRPGYLNGRMYRAASALLYVRLYCGTFFPRSSYWPGFYIYPLPLFIYHHHQLFHRVVTLLQGFEIADTSALDGWICYFQSEHIMNSSYKF